MRVGNVWDDDAMEMELMTARRLTVSSYGHVTLTAPGPFGQWNRVVRCPDTRRGVPPLFLDTYDAAERVGCGCGVEVGVSIEYIDIYIDLYIDLYNQSNTNAYPHPITRTPPSAGQAKCAILWREWVGVGQGC